MLDRASFYRVLFAVPILVASLCGAAFAQSPNNASIAVLVLDQQGKTVPAATVTVVNNETGARRESVSNQEGLATVAALPLTGSYTVSVAKQGFANQDVKNVRLTAGDTATIKVTLLVNSGESQVTVYGTTDSVRSNPQIGLTLGSAQIDETPILGRKVSSLPLLNSAFRQGKGTGDLFVNQTYFITGAGSRRTTSFTLDGANNDESWGRQTMIATVPMGAVQEMNVLSNAFSAEFGWTAGPAINLVTKSGTNFVRGDALYMNRPGGWQANGFSTEGFCPDSVSTCVTPTTLTTISPVDIPDKLNQVSGTVGAPIVKDRTFVFASADFTAQDRTTYLSPTLPAFVLPADGNLAYVGNYRQQLIDARVDHKLSPSQSLMVRFNFDNFYDNNPQDAVGGTNAPSVARKYSREAWTTQLNHTMVLSPNLLNEGRFNYVRGGKVTRWEAETLSTIYTRTGTVPFTVGQSRLSDISSDQVQFSDTLSWSRGPHYVKIGGSLTYHSSGGTGNEPGALTLGTFTFKTATTAPLDQLTLNDVQQYSQPISFGIESYDLNQWLTVLFVQDSFRVRNDLTLDLGLRYDNQSITDANANFAPRLGFSWHPRGDGKLVVRGGYAMYYTQIRTNAVAGYLINGLDGIGTYNATPGQLGFPTCLTGPCLPLEFDPRTLPASQIPARSVTIQAGREDFYRDQFARYGLNFDALLPYYPDQLVNPRSQVTTIGAEREVKPGFFVGADYVHQHWSNLDRSVDINAPAPFDRTASGQTRSTTAANATRPIPSAPGGVAAVNVLMNLGVADYDGLTTLVRYRANAKLFASLSYTLSKATNTVEPDGNGIAANQPNIARLGEEERGPSVVDQRHRAVISLSYELPFNITAGTVTQLASARPFNSTTGVDNDGDGSNNDRPVVNGSVIGKSDFRGSMTSDVSIFVEGKIRKSGRAIVLRIEGFNLMNHGNYLGRGVTTYGDTGTASTAFGQLVASGTQATALPAFANVDPPRMVQLLVRFQF